MSKNGLAILEANLPHCEHCHSGIPLQMLNFDGDGYFPGDSNHVAMHIMGDRKPYGACSVFNYIKFIAILKFEEAGED